MRTAASTRRESFEPGRGREEKVPAVDRENPPSPVIDQEAIGSVDVYLIRTTKARPVVFMTRRSLDACAAKDGDNVRRLIRKLVMSKNRAVRWFGRAMRTGHREYQKLEDRIDPQERIVKALNYSAAFRVWHAEAENPALVLGSFLRSQTRKHVIWLIIDSVVTMLALLLMPIPGPNVLGWYPFLRSLSHYRSLKGIRRAQKNLTMMQFEELYGLSALEMRFRQGSVAGPSADLRHIEGLDEFLARVG